MHVDTYQRFISNMAVELGCKVFSPEYRLAPETPWPKGDEDVHHATQHVFDNTEFYSINRKGINIVMIIHCMYFPSLVF